MDEYTIYMQMRGVGWVALVSYDSLKEATSALDEKMEELGYAYGEQPYKIVKEVADARI
tara:strand:- start:529 stop:705 length:177 start_codon:yes stop_codon:yes gene_type:complete